MGCLGCDSILDSDVWPEEKEVREAGDLRRTRTILEVLEGCCFVQRRSLGFSCS